MRIDLMLLHLTLFTFSSNEYVLLLFAYLESSVIQQKQSSLYLMLTIKSLKWSSKLINAKSTVSTSRNNNVIWMI